MERTSLVRYAWLSVSAAIVTIALKAVAWALTGSVGLLSDALESGVNLAAALLAVFALREAEKPADEEHAFGHEKAEYFASGAEGALVVVAAIAIVVTAVPRLLEPKPLGSLGWGLAISTAASLVNFAVARVLLTAGRRARSITLEADGHHLMTDVWTSAGVLVGMALVAVTKRPILDPLVAIAVAIHILRTGWILLARSGRGLMDTSLPAEERDALARTLDGFAAEGIRWHALKTRASGTRRFVSVHVLVPGNWTVQAGHDALERIEAAVRKDFERCTVFTHLEPVEDSRAWNDSGLDPTNGRAP
ncbi:MAG: cation diffusion facilitator family transporter [Polyangiaceae bacterium]